ncbi:MAG: serine/threonine protein kinase [Ktedonobacteraceae bacterium]|nr:serine/threonine protein kinase [Ktedonobacteraceae bacterium]MBO0789744.1 serine/threonine protein kinase [Ktedonobacteraceae bacterium]
MNGQWDPGGGDAGENQLVGRFGNYDLIRRIEVGGMGEVYLARQRTAFGREVAVKIIRPDLAYDVTVRKRFLREAEVSAHLKHDHILQLIEFSEHEGRLFLVTPYIKGGTLAQRLRSGVLPPAEVARLFSALVRAVSYVHKRGVIHRDLKPGNILLDRQEESGEVYVRLIDFGIASIAGSSASPPLTTNGHEVGTAAYMAPERLDGVVAPSNDIYSLGVILYQMLTGAVPPSTGKAGAIPAALEAIVDRCTCFDPADRFASADDLLRAFELACRKLLPREALDASFFPTHMLPDEHSVPTDVDGEPVAPLLTSSGQIAVVRPDGRPVNEGVFIHRADIVSGSPQSRIAANQTFQQDDYNATTSHVRPDDLPPSVRRRLASSGAASTAPPARPPVSRRRKGSLVATISIAMVILLVSITGIGYLIFVSSISATVTVTPQVQTVSREFIITAKIGQKTVDTRTSTIPAFTLTTKKTASQSGETTVPLGCILFLCKRVVTFDDVNKLADKIRPPLQAQIRQDLSRQEQTGGFMQVGNVVFSDTDGTPTSKPGLGEESKTLTVTLTEQGTALAIKSKDARDLAVTLLRQALPANFALIDQMTRVSQPVLLSISGSGDLKLAIAAGGVARYQVPKEQLNDIQNHVAGMKVSDARKYIIEHQAGLNGESTTISVSFSDTLPSNVAQIKLIVADPAKLPPVRLPTLPAVTPTIQA